MNPSPSQAAKNRIDLGLRVIRTLQEMALPAIPRNYELIYEAAAGNNPDLARAVSGLGKRPDQNDLDRIGERFLERQNDLEMVQRAQRQMTRQLESVLRLLGREQETLGSYGELLEEAYSRIDAMTTADTELLQSMVSVITTATDDTMGTGREIVDSVIARSREVEQVKSQLEEYKRIANTDPLTRLANRRAFDQTIAALFESREQADGITLVLIDIDHFKQLNDAFGHPVGDRVLAILGNVMCSSLPGQAFLARTGGEEFTVLLHETREDEADRIVENLRRTVEATPLSNRKTGRNYGPVTISLGVCAGVLGTGADDLYRKCDTALYAAKDAGRNRSRRYREGAESASNGELMMYRGETA